MTFATYNTNIPAANDNPSTDQPLMEVNTNSIAALIGIDHIGFNLPNGGTHNLVQLKEQPILPGLKQNGFETFYSKVATTTAITQGELFFSRGASNIENQLTGPVSKALNGYTFLPYGLLLQWGQATFTGVPTGLVSGNWPTAFSAPPYSVVAIGINSASTIYQYGRTVSTATTYTFHENVANTDTINFIAIGPA